MKTVQISSNFRVTSGDIFQAKSVAESIVGLDRRVRESVLINQGDGFDATFIFDDFSVTDAILIVADLQSAVSSTMCIEEQPIFGKWSPSRTSVYETEAVFS